MNDTLQATEIDIEENRNTVNHSHTLIPFFLLLLNLNLN